MPFGLKGRGPAVKLSAIPEKRGSMLRPLLLLILLSVAQLGCGTRVPSEFQVSGKPIEHWLSAIHDPDPKLRLKAVRALGNVGPHHPQAIPTLAKALGDARADIRGQAALALLKSGPRAKAAIPALETATRDADPRVCQSAKQALEKIGGIR